MLFPLSGKVFRLIKVGLTRMACPAPLLHASANLSGTRPIVVEINASHYGVTGGGFEPPAVITAGARRRNTLMQAGAVRSWAYVEAGIDIRADDQIGCEELSRILLEELRAGFPVTSVGNMQAFPYIREIYPFENYFIYVQAGSDYRQTYTLDPVKRIVHFTGKPVRVLTRYVDAGASVFTNYGARNSDAMELLTGVVNNWSNVRQAVAMYLQAIREGAHVPMKPMFCPVELTPDGKIASILKAAGVADYGDFVVWSATARYKKTKRKGGKDLTRSEFAYAPTDDPSTWKLPLDTPGRVRNALSRINQTKGVPPGSKAAVLHRVRRKAAGIGVGVSGKPTPKQKRWVA